MSPAQQSIADVTPVESVLASVIADSKQTERAKIVGLSCHSQINRREARLVTGEADTYLEVYPSHYLLRLAKADSRLGEAIVRFLTNDVVTVDDTHVERDLSELAARQAQQIATALDDLGDGELTRIEAARHSTALHFLQEQIQEVRIKLDRRARGARK